MGGTSTDICARLRRQAAHDQRVVRRVRPPDLLPVDRGADDRRGRRLAGDDRRGRLAAQRPAVGGLATPARRRTARAGRSRRTPTPTSCSAGSARGWSAAACQLDREAAESEPSRRSPSRSDLELHEAADAIIAVANANMADAVRIISLQRGYDPREFALVVFGGAGPLHGAALAKELGVPTVLVPPRPGTWSALGCLMVDIRHDLSEMFLRPAADADAGELDEAFERLEAEGRELLASEGVSDDDVTLERSIAMRYLGQWRSLEVALRRRPRGRRRALPRRARARVLLPPRRRARRALPAPARGHRQDRRTSSCPSTSRPGGVAARADRDARRSTSTARRSTRPSTSAASCPPACASKARP